MLPSGSQQGHGDGQRAAGACATCFLLLSPTAALRCRRCGILRLTFLLSPATPCRHAPVGVVLCWALGPSESRSSPTCLAVDRCRRAGRPAWRQQRRAPQLTTRHPRRAWAYH